jgi:replicative DNA helicase
MPRNAPIVNLEALFNRPVPKAVHAEMSLLGAILNDPNVLADVQTHIASPEDFYDERHAAIYRVACDIIDRMGRIDLVLLIEAIKNGNLFEAVGGGEYLRELAESVPSAAGAVTYAKIVGQSAALRRLVVSAGQAVHKAYDIDPTDSDAVTVVLDEYQSAAIELTEAKSQAVVRTMKELTTARLAALDSPKGNRGVKVGFFRLDAMTSGFQPGELVIVAARPSMGKTALAVNMAEGICGTEAGAILLFSLEMSAEALWDRIASAHAGVDLPVLRNGTMGGDQYRRVLGAADTVANMPIDIIDRAGLTITQLRNMARRRVLARKREGVPVCAIVIDYMQLLTSPAQARESRQVEVSAISRGIKSLARELDVPVICLSQLNRGAESREGNKPRMSDLRESGSIEQDADVVLLLHREDYYHISDPEWLAANPDKVGKAELIVAKQRNGPTGVVDLRWNAERTRFENIDESRGQAW